MGFTFISFKFCRDKTALICRFNVKRWMVMQVLFAWSKQNILKGRLGMKNVAIMLFNKTSYQAGNKGSEELKMCVPLFVYPMVCWSDKMSLKLLNRFDRFHQVCNFFSCKLISNVIACSFLPRNMVTFYFLIFFLFFYVLPVKYREMFFLKFIDVSLGN